MLSSNIFISVVILVLYVRVVFLESSALSDDRNEVSNPTMIISSETEQSRAHGGESPSAVWSTATSDSRTETRSSWAKGLGVELGEHFSDLPLISEPTALNGPQAHRRIASITTMCGRRVDGFVVSYRDALDGSVRTSDWHGSDRGRSVSIMFSMVLSVNEYVTSVGLELCTFKHRPQICYMELHSTSEDPRFKTIKCGTPQKLRNLHSKHHISWSASAYMSRLESSMGR